MKALSFFYFLFFQIIGTQGWRMQGDKGEKESESERAAEGDGETLDES